MTTNVRFQLPDLESHHWRVIALANRADYENRLDSDGRHELMEDLQQFIDEVNLITQFLSSKRYCTRRVDTGMRYSKSMSRFAGTLLERLQPPLPPDRYRHGYEASVNQHWEDMQRGYDEWLADEESIRRHIQESEAGQMNNNEE